MITNFLKTKRSKEELSLALKILREFKECESQEEWMSINFVAWVRLEQFEEFLTHLVDGVPLAEDTVNYIKRSNKK